MFDIEKVLDMQRQINEAHLGLMCTLYSCMVEMAQDLVTLSRLMQTALPAMDFEGSAQAQAIVERYKDVFDLPKPESDQGTDNVG
jgi:hypothetical protein